MLDIVSLIANTLTTSWNTVTVALPNIVTSLTGKDEVLDITRNLPQITILEVPETRVREEFIMNGTYRVEHDILLRVFVRPKNYTSEAVISAKSTFLNLKTEIERILIAKQYLIEGVTSITPTIWNTESDETKEPIVYQVSMVIHSIYYRSV